MTETFEDCSGGPEDYSRVFYGDLLEMSGRLTGARSLAVTLAYRLLGAPSTLYRSPETGLLPETGFDCSGFICAVVGYAGEAFDLSIEVPRHANEQWRKFGEYVDYEQRLPGDIVFFATRRKGSVRIVGHVGIVVSKGQYIHAPGKDNTEVTLATLPSERVLMDEVRAGEFYAYNPVGIKRLSLPIGSGRWHALASLTPGILSK